MSKIAIKGATTGTGVFTLESPATNTDRTLVLPDEAGTVLTSASNVAQKGVPAFSVYQSNSQTLSSNVFTKLTFTSTEFNTEPSYFSSSRFTPLVAGYYAINAGAVLVSTASAQTLLTVYKNGSTYKLGNLPSNSTNVDGNTIYALVYCNGTTDYIEIYGRVSVGQATQIGSANTYFQGVLVRAA